MEVRKVLINGALGQMGKTVARTILEGDGSMFPAVGIDLMKGDFPGKLFSSAQEVDAPFDVAIDFSRPEACMAVLDLCVQRQKPLVTGTTGLTEQQRQRLLEASRVIPVFYARNMSLGVNLQLALVEAATRILGDSFDPEIVETHHKLKVDAPSGTALMLAEEIQKAREGESKLSFGRHETNRRREPSEIGIHSLRGGNMVGEHAVYFLGTDEEIIITHRAESKKVFAQGALKAAAFLLQQAPGMYDMGNIVHL